MVSGNEVSERDKKSEDLLYNMAKRNPWDIRTGWKRVTSSWIRLVAFIFGLFVILKYLDGLSNLRLLDGFVPGLPAVELAGAILGLALVLTTMFLRD